MVDVATSGSGTITERYGPYGRPITLKQPGSSSDASPSYLIRRLPDVPPVPPIPRKYATDPRPLPISSASLPPPAPPVPVILRSASMSLGAVPKDEGYARPVSMGAVPSAIRPLPVLPSTQ